MFFMPTLDVAVFCLMMLIDKLKPKRGKASTDQQKKGIDPLNAIVCFAQVAK